MNTPEHESEQTHPFGLFFGGVPPYTLFGMDVDEVTRIVDGHEEEECDGEILLNKAAELGVIGLIAYFESFCKHQFAALVHCCPRLLERFGEQRPQISIPVRDLVQIGTRYSDNIGYVIAERFDFGSGSLINGLFRDLINVTPLAKDDVRHLDELLNDRNLLVHHSGLFTLNYAREKNLLVTARGGAFRDSLLVTRAYYHGTRDFLSDCASKIAGVTYKALDSLFETNPNLVLDSRPDALSYLAWEIDNSE